MAMEDSLGSGVELEWAIVYWGLRRAGFTFPQIQKRHDKLQPYSNQISKEAQQNVDAIEKAYGKKALSTIKHADEADIQLPPGIPEPKTDVLFKDNGKYITCSVKMSGTGYQLTSAEGKTSAKILITALEEATNITPKEKKRIIQVIEEIRDLPTKMLDPKNLVKAKKERPNIVKEILGRGSNIPKQKDYQYWKKHTKETLMEGLEAVMEIDQFKNAVIKEALTGQGMFGKNSLAAAKFILVGGEIKPIDSNLIRQIGNKTKIDVRSKARKGITSLALRIEAPS